MSKRKHVSSKRTTGAGSSSSEQLRDEEFGVIFSDPDQQSRFDKLKVREFQPTRFFDEDTLKRLDIYEIMQELMTTLGWETLFTMYHNSHRGLTFEFLSSLRDGKYRGEPALFFRISNRERRCTLSELAGYFGLTTEGNPKPDNSTIGYEIWQAMTGVDSAHFDTSHLYLRLIHHPCLRIFGKFLSTGLFARSDQNSMRTQELTFLAPVLRPDSDVKPMIPAFLFRYLLSLSSRVSKERITIGGIITRIATFHGFRDTDERVPEALLDYDHLHLSNYFRITGPFTVEWMYPPNQTRELPDPTLPRLLPNLVHYLLNTDEPAPPVAPPPQYSPFEQLMIDNFSNLNMRMDRMEENISGLQQQQQAAFGSMYGYFRSQGFDDGTFPSWFPPPGHDGAGDSGYGGYDPDDEP